MEFVEAAAASQIAPGTMHPAEAGGQKLLIANIDGSFHAMRRMCPHMGADLCKGKLDGKVVTCRMHGAEFDVTNGQLVPKAEFQHLKMFPKAPATFPVEVRGDKVMVGI